jgi:uncharacterized protein (TIGR00369 family)
VKRQHGFVHGGVVSYAADNALTYAGGRVLGADVVTSEFKINYLRPAQGERLIARGAVIHAGKSQAVCRCDVLRATPARRSFARRPRAPSQDSAKATHHADRNRER